MVVVIQEIAYSTAVGNELQLITKMPMQCAYRNGIFMGSFFQSLPAKNRKVVITNYLDEGNSNTRPFGISGDLVSFN